VRSRGKFKSFVFGVHFFWVIYGSLLDIGYLICDSDHVFQFSSLCGSFKKLRSLNAYCMDGVGSVWVI